MLSDLKSEIENITKEIKKSWLSLNPSEIEKEMKTKEAITLEEGFWNNRELSQKILSEIKKLKNTVEPWQKIKEESEELNLLYEMAISEKDETQEEDIKKYLNLIKNKFDQLNLEKLLGGELDSSDAFLTIQAGAGGTEACDWASMLMRMYLRWAERKNFKATIVDIMEAEGGVKSATIEIKGINAYGYLNCETGIHRLVRISPFDSSSRRHTSFCSVFTDPILSDDIEVIIKPDELRIDTYRAQGAGGQHVNTTDSAVRITHIPTGIVTQCQNERSQHKNKDTAMKMLKTKLYEHFQREKEAQLANRSPEKKEISWGNQIRSYVFHPYQMVKDHRTKYETGNTQATMDGDIDNFIEEFLKWNSLSSPLD